MELYEDRVLVSQSSVRALQPLFSLPSELTSRTKRALTRSFRSSSSALHCPLCQNTFLTLFKLDLKLSIIVVFEKAHTDVWGAAEWAALKKLNREPPASACPPKRKPANMQTNNLGKSVSQYSCVPGNILPIPYLFLGTKWLSLIDRAGLCRLSEKIQ